MDNTKCTARLAGLIYIMATMAPLLTVFFTGFLVAPVAPNYLTIIASSELAVIGGMLLEIVWALAVIFIPVVLYSTLKKQSETLSLSFFALRMIEGIMVLVGTLGLLTMLTLGQEFILAGSPVDSQYQTIGTLLLALRHWASRIGAGIIFSLSALVLNYSLYKSKIVPKWLSLWGLIGSVVMLGGYGLEFLHIYLGVLFAPLGIQEMVFAAWLLIKGFNTVETKTKK